YKWSQIKGDKGDKGDRGLQGLQGNKGDQGIAGVKGTDGVNGESLGDGFVMFRDPTFKKGTNSLSSYVGAPPVRTTKPSDAPTDSTHIIRFTNTGEVGSNNRWAGGVQYTNARANAIFIHRIVAKIPVGYTIQHYNNTIGTNGAKIEWLTPQSGSGRYETYMYKITCGTTGPFSNFGHFAFRGGTVGTPSNPVIFDVAFATMLDMQKYDDTADNSLLLSQENKQELVAVNATVDKLNQVTSYLTTTVDGNVISTGTLQVGATTVNAQGQKVSKAKAGITGVASSNFGNIFLDRRVVFWASTGFAERENAKFQVWDDGLVVMENARVKGHIEASSGTFKNGIFEDIKATRFALGSGSVGALEIEENRLYYKYDSALAQSYSEFYTIQMEFRNNSLARVGNISNLTSSVSAMGAFHNKKPTTTGTNYGIEVLASGAKYNHAINIISGGINNLSVTSLFVDMYKYNEQVSGVYRFNISKDNDFKGVGQIVIEATRRTDIILPINAEYGRIIWVKSLYASADFYIKVDGGDWLYSDSNKSEQIVVRNQEWKCVFVGGKWYLSLIWNS
ncbi:hypothetical protein ACPDG4_15150, partial [Myroides sp. C20-1]